MPRERKNGVQKKIKRAGGRAHTATARTDRTKTPGAHRVVAQKADAPEVEMPEANARKAAVRKASARKANTRKVNARETNVRETDARKTDALKVSDQRAASVSDSRSASAPVARSASVSAARPASSHKQTRVAVIGAGRLGSALARALGRGGYDVVALVARRAPRARLAALDLSPPPLALGATQLNLIPDTTDLFIVTTPDDRIAQVAARLAEVFDARAAKESAHRRQRVALHASGALLSAALAPLSPHGFSVGSLHPLVSIAEAESGAENLRGAFYCLEGEARALRSARKIVRALGGRSFSVAARDKPLYHAAAVLTAGHTVALFSLAAEILARCGLSDRRARQVLLPLLASTLDNLKTHAPDAALTGTFARADLSTVRQHLAALQDAADVRGATAVYALLGERSLQMAARRHKFDPSAEAEIALLLRKALSAVRDE